MSAFAIISMGIVMSRPCRFLSRILDHPCMLCRYSWVQIWLAWTAESRWGRHLSLHILWISIIQIPQSFFLPIIMARERWNVLSKHPHCSELWQVLWRDIFYLILNFSAWWDFQYSRTELCKQRKALWDITGFISVNTGVMLAFMEICNEAWRQSFPWMSLCLEKIFL